MPTLPARNATMSQFTSLQQSGIVNRPVVDKTGLKHRYDFDFEGTPDDIQFGGQEPESWQEEGRNRVCLRRYGSKWG